MTKLVKKFPELIDKNDKNNKKDKIDIIKYQIKKLVK